MTRRLSFLGFAAALAGFVSFPSIGLRAAGPRDSLVVSTEWMAQRIKDPNLVLLHVGLPDKYATEHIPGAQFIKVDDVIAYVDHAHMKDTDITTEMPEPAVLRQTLQRFGISNNSKIVVYYADGYYSPSTRIIYALNWAGLGGNTVLMQGGLVAWKRNGGAVTTTVPTVKPGTLSAITPHSDLIVDSTFVQTRALTSGFALVDGRDRSAYDGVPPPNQQGDRSSGHIPGAHSLPFTDAFDNRGELRSNEELETLFTKAGVKPGDTVVGYCWVGQQATAMLFAARVLGHDVKLYDGSIQDWTVKKLPLEVVRKGGGDR